jgi:hypothetical protein
MKKFRMMLPVLAVVFAIVGAVAGDLLPVSQGYYKISTTQCSQLLPTDQQDCFRSDNEAYAICTITVNSVPNPALETNCSGTLRHDN